MANGYARYSGFGGGSGGGGSGTVTSVGLADGSSTPIYTISGSPVTTAGTLTFTLNTETANTVFAGPTSGGAAQPTFRSLVIADFPTVNSNVGSFGSSTSIPSFTVNAQGLITAASGNVVIAPAGTLTGTTLASNVVTSSLTSLGTQSQALNMGSHLINAVTNPVSAQDAATKSYVDSAVAALQPATSVYAATTANISGTYLNGVAGVGATFTTTATGTFTVDGVTPPLASRILIKDQSSGFQNGIYDITTLGVIGVSTVFTRSLDYNTAADMNAAGLIPVINGTVNALSSWQQVATITTVGTDALVFTEFTANPSLYLLKANNLSDVANSVTSFNNLGSSAAGAYTIAGTLALTKSSTTLLALNSTAFVFDSTNNALGIGVAPATTTFIDGVNSTGAAKRFVLTGYGAGSTVGYRGRFARGTSGSPAAAQSGDTLNFISGQGYGTSQFPAASTGAINLIAGETFTNTSNATYIAFQVTPTTSVTAAEAMRVNSTGNVLIGTTTDSGTQKLQVNGNSNVGTVTAGTWNGSVTVGFSFLTAGTTYTTPANITTATQFKFTIIGAGGGGGGSSTTASDRGSGGGAGGTAIVIITGLSPSTGYTYAIGAGGTGASNANGTAGGNTTITINATTYTASGGGAGLTGPRAAGGAGGTTTNATIPITGMTGGSIGNVASSGLSGYGGTTMLGSGGAQIFNAATGGTNGSAGTGVGSGGSGGMTALASPAATSGGAGAGGGILVEWSQ